MIKRHNAVRKATTKLASLVARKARPRHVKRAELVLESRQAAREARLERLAEASRTEVTE